MLAIILSRRDFREYDQIISVYTKEKGKLDLLARGIKKIISKQAAHCEPFSYCMVESVSGREIEHLIKVVPIDLFARIRADFSKSIAAGYAVSFLNTMTEVGVPDQHIWTATLSWLQFVEEFNLGNSVNLVTLLDGYIVTLLYCLGLRPVLEYCVICKRTFQEMVKEEMNRKSLIVNRESTGLYFSGGGLICSECRLEKQRIGEEIAECGLKEVSNLQLLLTGNWSAIMNAPMTQKEKTALHRLVFEYAQYHSEKKIGDWGGSLNYSKNFEQ